MMMMMLSFFQSLEYFFKISVKREGKHETERGAKERIGRGTERRTTKIERRRVLFCKRRSESQDLREIYQRRHCSSPPDVFFNVVFVYLLKLFFLRRRLLLLRVRVALFQAAAS